MKLIIAGGRDYKFTQADIIDLDAIHSSRVIEEVVSGGATGADAEGERWATSRKIPVRRFPANWKAYGRSAGPIRNQEMAEYADAVALFPGGKGTADMRNRAIENWLEIFDMNNLSV